MVAFSVFEQQEKTFILLICNKRTEFYVFYSNELMFCFIDSLLLMIFPFLFLLLLLQSFRYTFKRKCNSRSKDTISFSIIYQFILGNRQITLAPLSFESKKRRKMKREKKNDEIISTVRNIDGSILYFSLVFFVVVGYAL